MSIKSLKNIWLAAAVSITASFSALSQSAAQTIVGTGDSSSFLVIEAVGFNSSPFVFEYRYNYDPENPLDTYDLLTAVASVETDWTFSLTNYGTEESPNYFLGAISYFDGSTTITLTNTSWPFEGPYWAQWVSGGEAGYPDPEPVASGSWILGSGLSAPYRALAPGSWDGLIYNLGDLPPSIAPVPEPSSFFLILAAGGAFYVLLRTRRSAARV